jgi:hypothetical protein
MRDSLFDPRGPSAILAAVSLVSAQVESIKHRFVQVNGIKRHITAPSENLCKFRPCVMAINRAKSSCLRPPTKMVHVSIPAGHLRDFFGLHLIQELVNGRG